MIFKNNAWPASELTWAFLVILVLSLSTAGQNIPDPDFDPIIAEPGYKRDGPKVLFDEAHHNYHTLGGRYKPFGLLLERDGYRVTQNRSKFTKDNLSSYAILVIVNAAGAANDDTSTAAEMNRSAFYEEECNSVRDWVETGGSLLLITDHYPFGGAAQSLAGRFDVEMSDAYTEDPSNWDSKVTGLMFSRSNGYLADSVITRGRNRSEQIDRVATFTGQSLKGPKDGIDLLVFSRSAVDSSATDKTKKTSAAGRVQGLALKFKKGRVVVLGEAAMLTSQVSVSGKERTRWGGLNEPGIDNRQFALNIMHWLSGLLN
jgi:hypothetical protein